MTEIQIKRNESNLLENMKNKVVYKITPFVNLFHSPKEKKPLPNIIVRWTVCQSFFFNKIWSIVRYNYKDPSFQYIQYFELQIKFVDTRGGMELLLLYRDENTINWMQYMLKWRKHFLRLKIIKRARWLCPFINDINFLRRIVQHDMKIWNDIQSCCIFFL